MMVVSLTVAFAGSAFSSVASAAEFGALETLAPSPVPLTALAVDPTTNFIYGLEFEGTKAFRYDPSTNAWTELPEAAINIGNNGGATYLDGKIYMSSTDNAPPLEIFDIATETWSTIPNPLGKGTADITSFGGELYMGSQHSLIRYNPATKVTTTLADPPDFSAAASEDCREEGLEQWGGIQVNSGELYASQGDDCNGFAAYNIAANAWSELTPVPFGEGEEEGPVAGSAFDPVSKSFFAYGTYGGHTLYSYNTAQAKWTLYTLPFEVNDGGLVYVSEPGRRGIYAIQGQDGTEFIRYSTPEPSSDLSIESSAATPNVTVGGEVTYKLTITNHGPYDTGGVTSSSTLPAGTTLVSASASQGSCSGTATVSCALGELANGASATVTIVLGATTAGAADLSSTVLSESPDPVPANNSSQATATIAAAAVAGPPATCSSRRSETVHWRLPKHVRAAYVVVTIDGKRHRLRGSARSVKVDMAGAHGGTTHLTVTAVTQTHKRYQTTRAFHPCTTVRRPGGVVSMYLRRQSR